MEELGYLRIGNMYLKSIELNIYSVSNDFIKNIEFTTDRKNAFIITKDMYIDLKKKLYINLDIELEKSLFIEKEN